MHLEHIRQPAFIGMMGRDEVGEHPEVVATVPARPHAIDDILDSIAAHRERRSARGGDDTDPADAERPPFERFGAHVDGETETGQPGQEREEAFGLPEAIEIDGIAAERQGRDVRQTLGKRCARRGARHRRRLGAVGVIGPRLAGVCARLGRRGRQQPKIRQLDRRDGEAWNRPRADDDDEPDDEDVSGGGASKRASEADAVAGVEPAGGAEQRPVPPLDGGVTERQRVVLGRLAQGLLLLRDCGPTLNRRPVACEHEPVVSQFRHGERDGRASAVHEPIEHHLLAVVQGLSHRLPHPTPARRGPGHRGDGRPTGDLRQLSY